MRSKDQITHLRNKALVSTFLCILFCIFTPPIQIYAKDDSLVLPDLNTFIETIKNGNVNELRGVYISDVMALTVVQQPNGNPTYVSASKSVVTQFSFATQAGNVGLLAHNTIAGSLFSNIKQGDLIILIYGDGHIEGFMTNDIQRYQALDPLNPYSTFKDLKTQNLSSPEELFNNVYGGKYHLTLQTCIENNGSSSWGRLFIIGTPIENKYIFRNQKNINSTDPFVNK